jgi:D-glycero-D-manno-heptose 1,7-bisphosphate phosphatase
MKVVFLDRDGVINRKKENGYVTSWGEFIFLPLVFEGLKILLDNGYHLFIITNQQGVGKKIFTAGDLKKIHGNMKKALSKKEIKIKRIYYCPHTESDGCDCRKPSTGMIKKAIKEFPDINLKESYLIGDSMTDIETGCRMGIKTILISDFTGTPVMNYDGTSTEILSKNNIRPDYIRKDLLEAAKLIVTSK